MAAVSRREILKGAGALALSAGFAAPVLAEAVKTAGWTPALELPEGRPPLGARHFTSQAIEALIPRVQAQLGDRAMGTLFSNCYPNTLDTTVYVGTHEGKPDTYVVTGDIDAMWLRDSSAQVWPYLELIKEDEPLRALIEGVIRRQARMVLIDPYANAFMRDEKATPLSWSVQDRTTMKPGVGERKWEVDSLCYTLRLAHGYWKASGDTRPFDAQWKEAAWTIVRTFRAQQRKDGPGPYRFQRTAAAPTETLALEGYGNPSRPVGMIHSMFRPSDDACTYPLFVPANLFAVTSLKQLAALAQALGETKLAQESAALAAEVEQATRRHGIVHHEKFGTLWAYEVDGFGNALMMDDANAPGLLSLPYLGACTKRDPLYLRTRAFALSAWNPYFFRGTAGEGIGGPHEGLDMVWPMSIEMRALTSTDSRERHQCLAWLRNTTAGTGFIHESFHKNDATKFTRSWFAWANTLMGELLLETARGR